MPLGFERISERMLFAEVHLSADAISSGSRKAALSCSLEALPVRHWLLLGEIIT
jgi:hypothetical protein